MSASPRASGQGEVRLEPTYDPGPGISTTVYRGTAPLAAHLQTLRRLILDDRITEAKIARLARFSSAAWLAFFAGPLAIIVGVIARREAWGPGLVMGGVVASVALGALAGAVSSAASKQQQEDLDNRRLHAAWFPLWTLRDEIAAKPVSLTVNFKPYDGGKPVLDEDRGSMANFKRRQRFLFNGWVAIELTLIDGTGLSLELSTRIDRKTKTKYKKRGKVENASQILREVVVVSLRAPAGRTLGEGAHDAMLEPIMMLPIPIPEIRIAGRSARFRFAMPPVRARRLANWVSDEAGQLTDGYDLLRLIQASYRVFAKHGLKAQKT